MRLLEAKLHRLQSVERRLETWIARDESKPNHARWPSFRENTRKLKRVRELILLTQEQLRQAQSPEGAYAAVVFGKRTKTAYRKSNVTRVLTQIYGGHAEVLTEGTRTVLRITNREPHAQFIEKRLGLMRAAISAERSAGVAPMKRAQLLEMERALIVAGLPGTVRVSGGGA